MIDGGGGSGKSTLVYEAKKIHAGKAAVFTREVGGTPFAEEIRKIFLSPVSKDVSVDAMLLLVTAARIDHIKRVVEPALTDGSHVICDRFDSSTYAYQIFGDEGYDLEDRFWSLREFYKETLPDAYIFLDIEPEKALSRVLKRNISGAKATNYFDSHELEFHERVYRGYKEFFKRVPCINVNVGRPLEEVKKDFDSIIKNCLKGKLA